ncbi:hypothetical protein Vadar_016438 [Vaccinium darrowii]|uniref:Uncharacterized protein n=1 Tax=Vaccinium darrowii TaxID=229202 RepID=A0ACB7YDU1_9ERIC|nr:hypothetical protein Vadar_016438 [Vaccinium darrowii]
MHKYLEENDDVMLICFDENWLVMNDRMSHTIQVKNILDQEVDIQEGPELAGMLGKKAAKWLERKVVVAELAKSGSTKTIAPGDFTEICSTLKEVRAHVTILHYMYRRQTPPLRGRT